MSVLGDKGSPKGHPSLDIVSSHGVELSGKKIVLCVAGSVAAYKAIELARLLMRHGADVRCVTSSAVTRLIRPEYFKWATGNRVITKLTGELEHIQLADYRQSDLIIVYPATANTLGKLANGIDDTPVSTVLTVGFGSGIPILMSLAMHASMYDNLAVKRNIEFLEKRLTFLKPSIVEGKAKAPEPEDVLEYTLRRFGSSSVLKDKRVLITAGPTVEHIDQIRAIINQSSGKTGVSLAAELVSAGAKVTFVYGPGREEPPKGVKIVNVSSSKEMHDEVKKALKKRFDVVIMAAAVADYTPITRRKTKISSSEATQRIDLRKTPKIIDRVRTYQKDVLLVGFKAEVNLTEAQLVKAAKRKLIESSSDFIVANDVGSARYRKDPQKNRVLIVDSQKVVTTGWISKQKIAKIIREEIETRIKQRQQ